VRSLPASFALALPVFALPAFVWAAGPLDPYGRAEPDFRPRHQGFFASFAAGAGSAQLRSNGHGSARESGVDVRLRAGIAITPQFTLALEGSAWREEEHPGHSVLGAVTVNGLYYPLRHVAGFLHIGAGPAWFSVAGTDSLDQTHAGVGGTVGVGYDVAVGGSWAITPEFAADLGGFDGFSSNVYVLSVAVTRH